MQTEYGGPEKWSWSLITELIFFNIWFQSPCTFLHKKSDKKQLAILKLWIVLSSDSISMVGLSPLQKCNFGG